MIEELLRETFTSHETLAPAPDEVRARIAAAARRRQWRRMSIGGTAVALVALVLLGAGTLVRPDVLSRPGGLGGLGGGPDGTRPVPSTPITFLLVGTDRRAGTDANELARADAIVLAHLPAGGGAAYLISIPRDELAGAEKLNGVYARGGVAALRAAVTARTRIPIDGTLELDLAGLASIVDAVGGVDLCVDGRVVSYHRPGVVYEPGCRHFTGMEATDYLRQRMSMPDGDLGRQRHNRQFLEAMYTKVAGADLATLANIARKADGRLRLDLGVFKMAELFAAVRGLSPGDVIGIEPPATFEGLTPAAVDLWTAVTAGTLPQWVAANPGRVS